MKIFFYLLLGLIQGVTEPIPVSSSGHLILLNSLFNVEAFNDLNFEIFVNFGSFIAIVVFYWNEIINIFKDFFGHLKNKDDKTLVNYNYAWKIAIATIPAGITGLLLKGVIEEIATPKLVGISLLITAILLFLAKDINGNKTKEDMTFTDALVVGLFQVISLFPGISRSGATLVGGMSRNLDKNTAFNFSFMLYLPISISTMILGIRDILEQDMTSLFIPYIGGMIIAGIFTYITVGWFKKLIENNGLKYFIYYCLVVGMLAIMFL